MKNQNLFTIEVGLWSIAQAGRRANLVSFGFSFIFFLESKALDHSATLPPPPLEFGLFGSLNTVNEVLSHIFSEIFINRVQSTVSISSMVLYRSFR